MVTYHISAWEMTCLYQAEYNPSELAQITRIFSEGFQGPFSNVFKDLFSRFLQHF